VDSGLGVLTGAKLCFCTGGSGWRVSLGAGVEVGLNWELVVECLDRDLWIGDWSLELS
jgi:hypothetical protein